MSGPISRQAGGLTLTTTVGLMAIGWMTWAFVQSIRIAKVDDAGAVLSLGCRKGQDWLLTTTTGTYPVRGWIHVEVGAPIQIQTRGNGERWICSPYQKVCVQTARRSLSAGFER